MPAEAKNFDSPDEVRPFEGNGQAKAPTIETKAAA